MKLTKSYLRSLIAETLQQGSTIDILATLKQNLPIIINNKLVSSDKSELAASMISDLKEYQRMTDQGKSFSIEDLSKATRYKIGQILLHIENLHKLKEGDSALKELATAYYELLKVYKILLAPN